MARDEPLHGTGAGSFEAHWLRERPISFYARDAHNLYLETLGELGALGLASCSSPRSRFRSPCSRRCAGSATGPAAAGAFIAYLASRRRRLGLGGAGRDAGRSLLRGRPARLAALCGLLTGSRRVSPLWRWRCRCSRSPSSCTSATGHSGEHRRDRAWRARSCARPGPAGDRLGPVVGRALAAARRGRVAASRTTQRLARA